MSKTRSIGCYGAPPPDQPDPGREIWAYDGALAILLGQLLRDVEGIPPEHRPGWWDAVIGAGLGLTAERARQIEAAALTKLRQALAQPAPIGSTAT